MMHNYRKLKNGAVQQYIYGKNDLNYEIDYASQYDSYGDLSGKMAYLRLGYIMGKIEFFKSILDFGYGNGAFLEACINSEKKAYGFDIGTRDVPKGAERVYEYLEGWYDVVTFFDSLEHCKDISFVSHLKCKYIVISVPHCHYPDDDNWMSNWKHLRPNEHYWHFNESALVGFMLECGFYPIALTNVEDVIRKNPDQEESNILTGIFRRYTP
jgi:hypothetical protein